MSKKGFAMPANKILSKYSEEDVDTIERCPHDPEHPYSMISNSLVRDNTISPECIWLITYLLSNRQGWKIRIPQIIEHVKNTTGKDKVYRILKEAIEAGYILRIEFTVNNLKRYKYVVSETPKFKKCFRYPCFQEAEFPDAENTDSKEITREERTYKETTTTEKPPNEKKQNSSSFSGKKIDELEALELSIAQKRKIYRTFTEERILKGLAWLKNTEGIRDVGAALYNAIQEGFEAKKMKQQIEKENRDYAIKKFSKFDEKDFRGIRIDICNKYIQFGNVVLSYDQLDFNEKIQEIEKKLNLSEKT